MLLGEQWKEEDKAVMLRFLVNSAYDEYVLKVDNQDKKFKNGTEKEYSL